MIRKIFFCVVLASSIWGCASLGPLLQESGSGSLTRADVVRGLKEALSVGISKGSDQASQSDGYFGNALIKIMMPPEAQKVETALRTFGLGKEVDTFILSLIRAAEDAAIQANPFFFAAITSITIQYAWGNLNGSDAAATSYLRKTSSAALFNSLYTV